MPSQPGCSACAFVSLQLGRDTSCLGHAGLSQLAAPEEDLAAAHLDLDEPSAAGATHPVADRPGLFTLHEYARLLVLRSHVQERRSFILPGTTGEAGRVEDTAARLAPWACPPWLPPYLGLVTGLRGEPIEELLNDRSADAESDPARAWRIDHVRAQVRLLETLHARGLLRTPPDGCGAGDSLYAHRRTPTEGSTLAFTEHDSE